MAEVFISHTSDLARFPVGRSFVQAAIESVVRARCAPADMSYFPASPESPASYCKRRVREADILVGLIGWRYGSLVPESDISYTELEIQEAKASEKPCLIFLLDEDAAFPRKLIDRDSAFIDGFRERLHTSGIITGTFATPGELERAVYQAITELQLRGDEDRSFSSAAHTASERHFEAARLSYYRRLMQNYRRLDLDVLTPAEHDEHLPVLLQ